MAEPLAPQPLASASTASASLADVITRSWRGPLLAALVVLVSALPGLLALPPLDRDESRFAQASAQMLETGDFVNIRYQDAPRDKKPVGIHWLQVASVAALSKVQARAIQPYRLPSLLGGMIAAAACAWGAAGVLGARRSTLAGAALGATILLSSEAFIAKTDAVLCGAVTLSMAALARLYLSARRGEPLSRNLKALFWVGQGVALLDKGPIGPMIAALTLLSLWGLDRDLRWARKLGWVWGLGIVLLIVGPWAVAITVATDGKFWGSAVGGDLAPKLRGGHEGHAAPPGTHALTTLLLFFPAVALLPGALVTLWRRRDEALVRFAGCWLVPSWLVFEATPTKLVHYTLPLYAPLVWLAVASLEQPQGRITRWLGVALSLLSGLAFAAIVMLATHRFGGNGPLGPVAALAAALAVMTGAMGAFAAVSTGPADERTVPALASALVFGVAFHMLMSGAILPALSPLWPSRLAARMVARHHLDPREGVVQGPVVVAGFAEPSLVFQLGTATDLADASDAVDGLEEGQPALVEQKTDAAFRRLLAERHVSAQAVDQISGMNYSSGKPVTLTLWRPQPVAP